MSFKAVLYVDIILQKRAMKKFIIRSERKTRQKRLSKTFSLLMGHARNRKQLNFTRNCDTDLSPERTCPQIFSFVCKSPVARVPEQKKWLYHSSITRTIIILGTDLQDKYLWGLAIRVTFVTRILTWLDFCNPLMEEHKNSNDGLISGSVSQQFSMIVYLKNSSIFYG